MLTNPRTVCACQLVAAMISASVAPFARFILAITSALLLVASDFDLPAAFFAGVAFFAALAFLAGLRLALGCAASGVCLLMFSESFVLMLVSPLTALRSSHSSLRFGETAR